MGMDCFNYMDVNIALYIHLLIEICLPYYLNSFHVDKHR